MDAVTYPNVQLQEYLSKNFVCLMVNEGEPTPDQKKLLAEYRALWSPALIYLDWSGSELRKVIGYRDPEQMLGDSMMTVGKFHLLHRRLDEAAAEFREIATESQARGVAAEARYWEGIAIYKKTRSLDDLKHIWNHLAMSHADGEWAKSANVLDYIPTGKSKRAADE
jgi:hypothetical protein